MKNDTCGITGDKISINFLFTTPIIWKTEFTFQDCFYPKFYPLDLKREVEKSIYVLEFVCGMISHTIKKLGREFW